MLVDVEPLYYLLSGQFPLHRFFHTFIGVALVVACTVAIMVGLRKLSARIFLPNLFRWQSLHLWQVVIGAALGGSTHVLLDSIMHSDLRPFAPFSASNPFLSFVSMEMLHGFCFGSGVAGVMVLGVRSWMRRAQSR